LTATVEQTWLKQSRSQSRMILAKRAHDGFFAAARERQPWGSLGRDRREHTLVMIAGNVFGRRNVAWVGIDVYSGDCFKCDTSFVICKRELKRADGSSTATRPPH
jgi:hypothetical protein